MNRKHIHHSGISPGWFGCLALLGCGLANAGTLTDNFSSTKGTLVGGTKIEGGILKLVDLADIKEDGLLPGGGLQGGYVYADLDAGKRVGSFNVKFKALVGGGTERPAQGFSMVFANDVPTDAPFREGGGNTTGLTVSFDTTDNQAGVSSNAEGNDPGDAPGVILKYGGVKVGVRKSDKIRTGAAFVDVEINLDADGTIDISYAGSKLFDNFSSGYIPTTGQFAFGAGTEERTSGTRDNHWIKDLSITTTQVAGAYISARSPSGLGARPDAIVSFTLEGLTQDAVTMRFDNQVVVPTVKKDGTKTVVSYDPPGLLEAASKHSVVLTYEGTRTYSYEFNVLNVPSVPASAKLAVADVDTATSGFSMRIYQDTTTSVNSTVVAENVLRGVLGPNEANLAKFKADGTLDLATINMVNEPGNPDLEGFFLADEIEIPGVGNSGDNYAIEFLGYLELKAGVNSFGVHSDDGFSCRIGSDPKSALATTLFQFTGTRGPAESIFSFIIPEDGIYPVRLMFFQNGGRANCEFYSVDANDNRTLINDRKSATAIKSYRARKGAYKQPPYVVSTSPTPNQRNVSTKPKFEIVIQDGASAFKAGSASLKVDGAAVAATAQTTGKETKITYTPTADLTGTDHKAELAYSDADNRSLGGSWTFTTLAGSNICAPTGSTSSVTGYWNFSGGNLKGVVGSDIKLRDDSQASHYIFGTTGQGKLADIPGIGGKPAKILGIPFTDDAEKERKLGLQVAHGLKPNGGGTLVNQWTMIADILWVGDGAAGFGTLLRTSDFTANKDGDLFWRKSDGNYGKGCCSLYDNVAGQDPGSKHEAGAWGRVVLVADFASEQKYFAKYVNGFLHRQDVQGDANKLDGRFSLAPEVLMFNDGDDNEQDSAYIAGIQFREGVLTADEVKKLGGPSADGIPMPASSGGGASSGVGGYWTFDNGDLKATSGKDIALRDASLASHYVYGTTGQGKLADIPNIGGKPAKVVGIPFTDDAEKERKLGFLVDHGMAPNGGGTLVNQWTMIADLLWVGDGAAGFGTLLRTSDFTANKDGDLFWRKSDGNYGKGCCSLYDNVAGQDPGSKHEAGAWARFVIVADFASEQKYFAKYVNGFLHRQDVQGDANKLDGRFSLASQVLMFNDGDDNEQDSVYINALQFRPGILTADQVKALGGPSADGIPLPSTSTTTSPLTGYWTFDAGDLKASHGKDIALRDATQASHYVYGTTGQGKLADIPNIGGKPAKVVGIPFTDDAEKERKLGFLVDHGVAPNGGGQLANQWTMIADLLWVGDGAAGFGTLLRTSDFTANKDGDLFWRKSDGNYGKGCCSLYDNVAGQDPGSKHEAGAWGRLVLVADFASEQKYFAKYVNGFLHRQDVQGDANKLDGRFSLASQVLMFNDGDDNEQDSVYINAIQFRTGVMTADQVKALGGPSADGIPLPASTSGGGADCTPSTPVVSATLPKVSVGRAGANLDIKWNSAAGYILEGSSDLRGWSQIQGVTGGGHTPALQGKQFFYRLRKQ